MGSTIRRQPIDTRIPSNPKYYFQNITNFGGINITSNPFQANANTASDSLNVYVDEEAALTTRPRLSLKYDLNEITYSDPEYIGVYNLHDGYLLHGKLPHEQYFLMKIYPDGDIDLVSGIRPKNRCVVFEQNNTVYLLDGTQYLAMTKNDGPGYTVADVEGYVPILYTGKTMTTEGTQVEHLNLLSDRYKETYKWNGTTDALPDRDSVLDGENEYFSKIITDQDLSQYKLVHYYEDYKIFIAKTIVDEEHGYTANYYCGTVGVDNSLESFKQIPNLQSNKPYYNVMCAPKKLQILQFFETPAAKLLYVFEYDEANKNFRLAITKSVFESYQGFPNISNSDFKCNSDCTLFWNTVIKTAGASTTLRMFVVADKVTEISNLIEWQIPSPITTHKYNVSEALLVDGVNELVLRVSDYTFSNLKKDYIFYTKSLNKTSKTTLDLLYTTPDGIWVVASDLSYNGNSVVMNTDTTSQITGENYFILTTGLLEDTQQTKVVMIKNPINTIGFINNSVLYYTTEYGLFIISDVENLKQGYFTYIKDSTVTKYTGNSYLSGESPEGIYFFKNTEIPLVTITKKINSGVEYYDKWIEAKEKFYNTTIFSEFNNRFWFGSNNRLYWSETTDPTYIPYWQWENLGYDYSELTGLNRISDNVLMGYKKDRLYIVTPNPNDTTGFKPYSFTETKSVEGNVPKYAPIVTVLNEYPTFVNYNGIYALRQLENVQSSDRIAELLSDPINPKWLAETRETIDSCKTINRLYWTYYIMNYNNPDKPKEWITKVYLFDNRTTSWFYWELPLKTLDVFVKDDKTTFVSTNGEIFTLETTDIPNRFNPEVLEYYDYGEKLIRWHWKSQILPLNTINYSKKLIETTFVLTDTDAIDNYGLNYEFTAYRRAASQTTTTTISDNLNYVQSTTKRTLIPRFNFIQLEIMNIEDDDMFDRNKLRLIGLALKYVLLNYGT